MYNEPLPILRQAAWTSELPSSHENASTGTWTPAGFSPTHVSTQRALTPAPYLFDSLDSNPVGRRDPSGLLTGLLCDFTPGKSEVTHLRCFDHPPTAEELSEMRSSAVADCASGAGRCKNVCCSGPCQKRIDYKYHETQEGGPENPGGFCSSYSPYQVYIVVRCESTDCRCAWWKSK